MRQLVATVGQQPQRRQIAVYADLCQP